MRRYSLATLLLLVVVPSLACVAGIVAAATYAVARTALIEELERGVRDFNEIASSQVGGFFHQRRNEIMQLAESPLFRDHYMTLEYGLDAEAAMHRAKIEETLARFAERAAVYPDIRYVAADGRILARVRGGRVDRSGGRIAARDLRRMQKLEPGERTAIPLRRAQKPAVPIMRYAAGIFDESRALRGALLLDCSLDPVYAVLGKLRGGVSGKSYLVPRERWHAAGARPHRHGDRISATGVIAGTEWSIVSVVGYAEFLDRLQVIGSAALFAALFVAVFTTLFIILRMRVLLRPLTALADAARELGRGRFDAALPKSDVREIEGLARAFAEMAGDLRRLTEDLRRSEAGYRAAVENSPHAVINLDARRRIKLWNRRAEELFGYTAGEAMGRDADFLLSTGSFADLASAVHRAGGRHLAEAGGRTKNGDTLELLVGLSAGGSLAGYWHIVIEDLTETKRLRSQLMQAEKMTAVGNLIAGVAHELNNPLAAVIGFAEMLKDLPGDAEEREDLRHLHESALRCRDIVNGLLQFVRPTKVQVTRVSLNEAVQATLRLLEYRIVRSEGIRLETRLDPAAPEIAGDLPRLQQVVVNLISNAVDALHGKADGRRIRVRTRSTAKGPRLEVEDSGPGVAPAKRARIFEPFFTTKRPGRGTGLGLSISANIAEEFGAQMSVADSDIGGARFVIRFPPCPRDLPAVKPQTELPPPLQGRKVLVVDDEADVARMMVRLLTEDGLKAEAVCDPGDALTRICGGRFHLVVADIDLGAVRGTQLYDAVRAKTARMPAFVFATGDVLNRDVSAELARYAVPVLAKPFLRSEFLRVVRRALSAHD